MLASLKSKRNTKCRVYQFIQLDLLSKLSYILPCDLQQAHVCYSPYAYSFVSKLTHLNTFMNLPRTNTYITYIHTYIVRLRTCDNDNDNDTNKLIQHRLIWVQFVWLLRELSMLLLNDSIKCFIFNYGMNRKSVRIHIAQRSYTNVQ